MTSTEFAYGVSAALIVLLLVIFFVAWPWYSKSETVAQTAQRHYYKRLNPILKHTKKQVAPS